MKALQDFYNVWRMFISSCVFFMLLTKGVKSGISFSLQTTMKMFSEFMFGVKIHQI